MNLGSIKRFTQNKNRLGPVVREIFKQKQTDIHTDNSLLFSKKIKFSLKRSLLIKGL